MQCHHQGAETLPPSFVPACSTTATYRLSTLWDAYPDSGDVGAGGVGERPDHNTAGPLDAQSPHLKPFEAFYRRLWAQYVYSTRECMHVHTFVYVCMHVCTCVCDAYMCSMHVCMHVHTCLGTCVRARMWTDLRLTLEILFTEVGLLVNPELAHTAGLTSQLVQGLPVSAFQSLEPQVGHQVHLMFMCVVGM